MNVEIPTPTQLRYLIKKQTQDAVNTLKVENEDLRKEIRGLEEAVKVI